MTLEDYSKFYEMLLNGGVGSATGERVLSPLGVQMLVSSSTPAAAL